MKDIKPVGRERDIQIAELKGIKLYVPTDEDLLKMVRYDGTQKADEWIAYIPSGKPWKTHSIDSVYLPHYSTNRNDAWELLLEMTHKQVATLEIVIMRMKEGHKLTDKLFADIVSYQWIQWKVGQ